MNKSLLENRLITGLLILLLSNNIIYSQQYLLSKKVAIEFKNINLEKAINILNQKMDHILSYKNKIFPNNKIIKEKFSNSTLKEVLEKLLFGTDIIYFESGKQIILKPSKNNEKSFLSQTNPVGTNLSGFDGINTIPAMANKNVYSRDELQRVVVSYLISDLSNTQNNSKTIRFTSKSPTKNIDLLSELPISTLAKYNNIPPKKEIEDKEEEFHLKGCSAFSLSPGIKTNSSMVANTTESSFDANVGFTGSLAYGYWITDEWQLNLQAGLFVAEANIKTNNINTKSIVPILFGVRYYPSFLSLGNVAKLYVGASVGAYIGAGVSIVNDISTTEATESKTGFQSILGLDFFITDWLKIGPSASYHKFEAFTKITTQAKDYSGAEFSINMGVVL